MGEELFEKCMEDMVSGDKQGLRMIYEAYAAMFIWSFTEYWAIKKMQRM